MSVPDTDYQCPNRNIYVSEVWTLLKNYSKKLGYIYIYLLKLVTFVYTLDFLDL